MTTKTMEIGVLLVGDGIQFTDIAPADTLALMTPETLAILGPAVARLQSQTVLMNISYINERGEGLFCLTGGAKIAITHSLTTAPLLDVMIVPGPPPVFVERPAVDAYIQAAVARGTAILSICTGAFPVAAAGVLDGRTATAPLGLLPVLRAKHPRVQWQSARRFEKSAGGGGQGDIWTSGAVANGMDLTCAFMRERFPESRALMDLMIGFAGIAQREAEYNEKEKALEEEYDKAFEGASGPV